MINVEEQIKLSLIERAKKAIEENTRLVRELRLEVERMDGKTLSQLIEERRKP
ncbi:MAG: hypothetical protein KKA31_01640 [Candidatus Margulisbacteria bacterium]|nr:hypothetical protein [Candidatus Margulisiibacteriota bacterium]